VTDTRLVAQVDRTLVDVENAPEAGLRMRLVQGEGTLEQIADGPQAWLTPGTPGVRVPYTLLLEDGCTVATVAFTLDEVTEPRASVTLYTPVGRLTGNLELSVRLGGQSVPLEAGTPALVEQVSLPAPISFAPAISQFQPVWNVLAPSRALSRMLAVISLRDISLNFDVVTTEVGWTDGERWRFAVQGGLPGTRELLLREGPDAEPVSLGVVSPGDTPSPMRGLDDLVTLPAGTWSLTIRGEDGLDRYRFDAVTSPGCQRYVVVLLEGVDPSLLLWCPVEGTAVTFQESGLPDPLSTLAPLSTLDLARPFGVVVRQTMTAPSGPMAFPPLADPAAPWRCTGPDTGGAMRPHHLITVHNPHPEPLRAIAVPLFSPDSPQVVGVGDGPVVPGDPACGPLYSGSSNTLSLVLGPGELRTLTTAFNTDGIARASWLWVSFPVQDTPTTLQPSETVPGYVYAAFDLPGPGVGPAEVSQASGSGDCLPPQSLLPQVFRWTFPHAPTAAQWSININCMGPVRVQWQQVDAAGNPVGRCGITSTPVSMDTINGPLAPGAVRTEALVWSDAAPDGVPNGCLFVGLTL
jgi:hypothetical protein